MPSAEGNDPGDVGRRRLASFQLDLHSLGIPHCAAANVQVKHLDVWERAVVADLDLDVGLLTRDQLVAQGAPSASTASAPRTVASSSRQRPGSNRGARKFPEHDLARFRHAIAAAGGDPGQPRPPAPALRAGGGAEGGHAEGLGDGAGAVDRASSTLPKRDRATS